MMLTEGRVAIGALIIFTLWLFVALPLMVNAPSLVICAEMFTASWAQVYTGIASAVATLGAVIVAIWVAAKDSRRRLREKEHEQAERITAWMFEPEVRERDGRNVLQAELFVNNTSDQLIYKVIASVANAETGAGVGGGMGHRRFIGLVPPGTWTYEIEHPGHGMHKRFSIELVFQDAANRTWRRSSNGDLSKINGDPLSFCEITPPVYWEMPSSMSKRHTV
jgi:hypothetical protein